MTRKRGWYQVSIRGLLACSLIVAMGLLIFIERAKRHAVEEHLSELMPGPQVWVHTPVALQDEYWTQGTFGVAGALYIPDGYVLKQSPTVEVKLLEPKSGTPILEVSDKPVRNGALLDFNCELRCGGVVFPGVFPVSVEVTDGTKVIARTLTLMRFVDIDP